MSAKLHYQISEENAKILQIAIDKAVSPQIVWKNDTETARIEGEQERYRAICDVSDIFREIFPGIGG